MITQSGYGGVVQHIEPHHIESLPIPILPESKQQEIHNLIVESAKLRVLANKSLNEAIELFENYLVDRKINRGFQYNKISSRKLSDFHKRFDSQYQVNWKNIKDEYIKEKYSKISNLASNIFVGGRGKRNYVENGIPFLSSSDMMLFNPLRLCKSVSFNTPGIKQMKVEKYDILISRSGTVGNTIIVSDSLKGAAVSEHALRLKIDSSKISPNYVFTYLKTKIGMKAMEASAFGSVIITLNEELIGNIDVPILEDTIQNEISEKIDVYLIKMDESTLKENQAIELIEKEIDGWQ